MPAAYLIEGGRIIDPVSGRDEVGSFAIIDGVVEEPNADLPSDCEPIDATGLIVAPAFVDLHVHFREPGGERAETIASGCRAAHAGGFGTVVTMPNTRPPIDTPARLKRQIEAAQRCSRVQLLPSACITRGRAGEELSDMEELADAGAAFFTDDGSTVISDELMRDAMRRAAELGLAIVDHAQRSADERAGVMHSGRRSRELGLPGIPAAAETEIIARDIRLAEETGCAIHIQHITSAAGVALVADGKRRGVRVSAEATPHHIALCEDDLSGADANFKMNPPLRSAADRAALRDAVCSGVIDCFATDHAPHPRELKDLGFMQAPFGVVGLETAVGASYSELVANGGMNAFDWVERWTSRPLALLNRSGSPIASGYPGRITLIDPEKIWTVDPRDFESKSSNTCFAGRQFQGRVCRTILSKFIPCDG